MSTQTRQSLCVLLLIVSLFCYVQTVFACGPFTTEAVFTFTVHPEFPLERFAGGDIGIVQPTYARSYLYAAYRNLSGAGFNPEEQKALVELWKERLDYTWEDHEADWTAKWIEARGKVAGIGTPPKIEVYRSREKPNEYDTYLNCQEDAFLNAASTLEERVKKFGGAGVEVKDWVQAQDQVFANCSEGQHIPASAAPDAPALIRADRAYQIAAANFYAGNFDEAKKLFEAIAGDANSPWREKAAYLIARTLLRKASLGPDESKKESLAGAESQLNKVLKDGNLSASHHAASRLLNLVRVRLHPEDKLHELAHTLVQKDFDENLKQDLWDYTLLLDDFVGDEQAGANDNKPPTGLRSDDVTDWIITFQSGGAGALDHSLQKWSRTGSLPWLVAALSKVPAGHTQVAALLEAASKVKSNSAAFANVSFHSIRLLNESGRGGEARQKLDDLLTKDRKSLPHSALNLFLAQRLKLASNLFEFLTYAQRTPAGFSWDEDGREQPEDISQDNDLKVFADGRTLFDVDAARVLNEKMPLSVLKDAATSNALPEHLRRDLAQATWLRAVLLDDDRTASELVPLLKSLVPSMSAHLDDYLTAKGSDAKKFAAIYAWLQFPGLEPNVDSGLGRLLLPLGQQDAYRDNWWCSSASGFERANAPDNATETKDKATAKAFTAISEAASPLFLDQPQKTAALKEHERLANFGAAPNYLSRQVISWATRNPNDPRVPEALHLAIKATRYGCPDKETGAASKAAFQLLHKRYPASPWAKKTPYWYKDS
ncbi:MAG TPA: hypothetical protein VGO91_12450 [Pyrinomonadaceae bacterium]|jgi:hypothetical protein|nr:hypothetical protein [Pyrinomonadaceae bacterium]